LIELLKKLNKIFDRKEKRSFLLLSILMIVSALLETLGIGLILPFFNLVNNPGIIFTQKYLLFIYNILHLNNTASFIIIAAFSLIMVYVVKNLYLFTYQFIQARLVYHHQIKLSSRLLACYLKKNYSFHLQKNSAELLRNVNLETDIMFGKVILPLLNSLAEVLVIISVVVFLFIISPYITLISFTLITAVVFLFFSFFRKKVKKAGMRLQHNRLQMIKWVNQGFGAIKQVKVSGTEEFFITEYTKESKSYAKSLRFNQLLGQAPRLLVETVIVCGILLVIILFLFQGKNIQSIMPIMAIFTVAAFRMIASMNRVSGIFTTLRFHTPSIDVIYNGFFMEDDSVQGEVFAQMSVEKSAARANGKPLQHSIQLQGISFKYPMTEKFVVKDVSLSIPIGKSVAFIGESGAGKTTLLDIILGLLKPTTGQVLVDGRDIQENMPFWQGKVGYIPQNIYLLDDSIKRNIAFGIKENLIDEERVWRALELAQLKDFVLQLPDGLTTSVGESGVRLSGGQRQRIGIARALYGNPEVLVLDEATSSLDTKTEKEIVKSIDRLRGNKTLIIITHRLSTIENCDTVYEFDHGRFISIKDN